MFDSIKTTRAKNIEHTTSLIANNDKFKAQLQEKGFAIVALKNELRKLTRNSVNTKFAKSSILGKPALQPRRNKSVVRQPTAFNHYTFLNEVNSRAKVPSNKKTKRYIPVEQISVAKKSERHIPKRHRSLIKKTSVVHEKTMTPRSCLRWKPTGKIFKTVGLRWIPTGKIFTSSTTKVDSEPINGSNDDITNQYECKQTLDVSACTLNIHASTSLNPTKEGLQVWLLKRLISEKPGLQGIFI
ncbi:hypothetical protein Tco_1286115 [Tanacetum coccineum]